MAPLGWVGKGGFLTPIKQLAGSMGGDGELKAATCAHSVGPVPSLFTLPGTPGFCVVAENQEHAHTLRRCVQEEIDGQIARASLSSFPKCTKIGCNKEGRVQGGNTIKTAAAGLC